ncbi:hypothetical protein ACVWXL_005826 [Bradyrhizobium sp. GM22.5]
MTFPPAGRGEWLEGNHRHQRGSKIVCRIVGNSTSWKDAPGGVVSIQCSFQVRGVLGAQSVPPSCVERIQQKQGAEEENCDD